MHENETTEQRLARLEQATAPDAETTLPVDDETAMLRESWLALGKLLDAADVESQESGVSRQKPGVSSQESRLRLGKLLGFMAALAASLVVALVAWSIIKRGNDSINPKQELAVPNKLPESAPAVADVAPAPQEGESPDVIDEFAWEDSFDEQLAATSQAIRSVRADWNGGDRRYSVLLDQFEQFDEELSEGAL